MGNQEIIELAIEGINIRILNKYQERGNIKRNIKMVDAGDWPEEDREDMEREIVKVGNEIDTLEIKRNHLKSELDKERTEA